MAAKSMVKILLLSLLWLLPAPAAFAADGEPAIAPGTAVVFVAGEKSKRSIMMVDPAGGMPVTLVDSPGADTQPAVGPQGQLAWIHFNGRDWDLMENGRRVAGEGMYLSPAYSPSGVLAAAFSGENETSLFTFDGSKKILLIKGRGGLAVSPVYSPDGGKLAYVSNESGLGQVYVAPASGGATGVMVTSSPVRSTDPAWAPDGSAIAFVAAETDICLINPDGGGLRQLTRNQGENAHPSFSPDGKTIVFSSNRNGRHQLFVMNVDGTGQRPLLPGFSPAQSLPMWAATPPKPMQ